MTLLELILALSLSAILVTVMAAAIRIALSNTTTSRGDVEQMRLVQGVISRLADDIKAAAVVETLDISGAMALAEAARGFDVDTIDTETIGAGAGGGGGSLGMETGGMEDPAQLPTREPLGVIGYPDSLRIDVLREEPQLLLDEQGMVVATAGRGGIYTVLYQIGDGVATLGTPKATLAERDSFGLVRQEVNRDILNWANQMGRGAADVAGEPLLVSAEVEQLQFRYFDGYEYFETWDPYQQGPWPRAIEVRLWFRHSGRDGKPPRHHEERPYVVTVALPMAWNSLGLDSAALSAGSPSGGSSSMGASGGAGGGVGL